MTALIELLTPLWDTLVQNMPMGINSFSFISIFSTHNQYGLYCRTKQCTADRYVAMAILFQLHTRLPMIMSTYRISYAIL